MFLPFTEFISFSSEPICPTTNSRAVIAAAPVLSPAVASSLSPTTSFKWPFANSPVSPTVSPKSQGHTVSTQNFAFYNADSPTIAQSKFKSVPFFAFCGHVFCFLGPNEYENDNETAFGELILIEIVCLIF